MQNKHYFFFLFGNPNVPGGEGGVKPVGTKSQLWPKICFVGSPSACWDRIGSLHYGFCSFYRKIQIKRFVQADCFGFHFVCVGYFGFLVHSVSLSFKYLVLPPHFLEFWLFNKMPLQKKLRGRVASEYFWDNIMIENIWEIFAQRSGEKNCYFPTCYQVIKGLS